MAFIGNGNFLTVHGKINKTISCDSLFLDFEKGTINDLNGKASMDDIKKVLPCYTGSSPENNEGMNCGGGIFYLDHHFFYYTKADYIEVRNGFNGKTTLDVLGQPRFKVIELIGEPDDSFSYTDEWLGGETIYSQYKKDWGTLVMLSSDGTISRVQLHFDKKIGEIDFCF